MNISNSFQHANLAILKHGELDLQNKDISDFDFLGTLGLNALELTHLNMMGNPISQHPHYRKILISRLKTLVMLDNIKISFKERILAEAWMLGGEEAEWAQMAMLRGLERQSSLIPSIAVSAEAFDTSKDVQDDASTCTSQQGIPVNTFIFGPHAKYDSDSSCVDAVSDSSDSEDEDIEQAEWRQPVMDVMNQLQGIEFTPNTLIEAISDTSSTTTTTSMNYSEYVQRRRASNQSNEEYMPLLSIHEAPKSLEDYWK